IPELVDSIVLEPKEMDHDNATVLKMLTNMQMHGNIATVLKSELHVQYFVRILRDIIFHNSHKQLAVTAIIGIVMTKIFVHAALVGLCDSSPADEAQERNGRVFSRIASSFHGRAPVQCSRECKQCIRRLRDRRGCARDGSRFFEIDESALRRGGVSTSC